MNRILALLCVVSCAAATARAEIKVGDTFPKLAEMRGIVMLGGGNLPPTDGTVFLVDFWASWCAPCKASFPALAKIHGEYSRRGLVMAAISVDDKLSDAMQFLRTNRVPFVTLHDREKNLVKVVEVPTMPTTYLIGRDGKVRYMHNGYHGAETDKLLREQIAILLAERAP